MSGGEMASSIYLVVMLMLVASAFAARRIPMKQTVKMVLGWVAIFALGFLLLGIFNQLRPAATDSAPGSPPPVASDRNFT